MARDQVTAEELVKTPDHVLADRILKRLDRRDPDLRKLFVNAAVPRKADPGLLARLTASSVDRQFMATFRRLTQAPYVKALDHQSLTVHDEIRQPLLTLWDKQGFGRTLSQARQLIMDVWLERYQAACLDEEALDMVGGSFQEADPSRFRSARRAIRREVDDALVELVNSAVSVDPKVARNHLDSWFNERAERRDYTRCDLLARALADSVAHLEDRAEVATDSAWAAYYRSSAMQYFEDWDGADDWLEQAEGFGSSDPILALWLQGARARILIGQNRLIDAQAASEKLISMNESSRADPWNEHVAHERLASVLSSRWYPDEAADRHQAAINSALAASNVDAAIECRIAMALSVADRATATMQMIRAIVDARLRSTKPATNLQCAGGALVLFGSASPRLACLFSHQVRQLSRGSGESATLDLLANQADALEMAGLSERAVEVWDRAIALALDANPVRLQDAIASRASLLNEVGRAREAATVNRASAEDPLAWDNLWHRARCTTNAAFSLLEVTDAETALQLAETAHELFSNIGNERAATLTWIIRAEAHRIQAKTDLARIDLAHAVEPLPPAYEGYRQIVISRVASATGERAQAADTALHAYTIKRDLPSRANLLPMAAEALQRLAEAGRFTDTVQLAEEIRGIAQEITDYGKWQSNEATTAADAHVAEALRIWKAGIGDEGSRLNAAREHLREALEHDPQEGWISFEAGLADRASGDLKASGRRLAAAIETIESGPIRDCISVVVKELAD